MEGSWQGWFSPNPHDVYIGDELPNFTQSLDDCIKWLLPKLERDNSKITIGDKLISVEEWLLHILAYKRYIERVSLVNPIEYWKSAEAKIYALGLCLAIEKLIDTQEVKEGKE